MTSLVTTNGGLPALAKLQQLYTAIEQIETPEDAATLSDQAKVVLAALKAADVGLDVQNEAAALRLTAERKLGIVLVAMDPYASRAGAAKGASILPEGVSRDRSSRAQKLARIADGDWDTYLSNTRSSGREITFTSALKLAPVAPREERKSLADTYTAPPIDIQLAREFGLSTDDELAQIIVDTIQEALETIDNPRHAYVWARRTGIKDDGTIGDTWTFAGIAAQMGVSREVVESLYYRASHHVRGALAAQALNRLRAYMLAA